MPHGTAGWTETSKLAGTVQSTRTRSGRGASIAQSGLTVALIPICAARTAADAGAASGAKARIAAKLTARRLMPAR
jgi:hypothetical protein